MNKITWLRGYSAAELDRVQTRFGLQFPADLVDLLRDRRPVGGPDWNRAEAVRPLLDWPLEGLLFDVEEGELWWPEWGSRPETASERKEVVQGVVRRAPRLIPIVGHRYLPETPGRPGNPVFSVYQSDVIYYGANLADYIRREEGGLGCAPWPEKIREIEFWSELVRRNDA